MVPPTTTPDNGDDSGGGETPTPPTPTPPDNGDGDIGDAGTDIKWDNLPDTPIVSADKVFDKTGTETPQTPVHPDNVLSLIGLYDIAYISVKAPDGTTMPGGKMIIDSVIGSGNNMRGEFAVNAGSCTPAMGITCPVGIAIGIQMKFQFSNELVAQGVPQSIQFLRKTVYKPLTSMDIPKEFENLGAKIEPDPNDPGNYIVNFTMTSPDIPMPKGYEMVLSLKKSADDKMLESTIVLDDSKYFSESSAVASVTLDKSTADMFVGDKIGLSPTVMPLNATNKSVVYSSSDESVATVNDKGIVTAKGEGQATITVTTQEGDKTAQCIITVTNYIALSSIAFTETSVFLDMDKSDTSKKEKTLTLNLTPADATDIDISFTTSNSLVYLGTPVKGNGVITVKITALNSSAENVTITASNQDGSVDATSNVSVIDSTVYAESVTLDVTSKALTEGDTFTPVATVLPLNTFTKDRTFASANPAVATVNRLTGEVTAIAAGSATITVTTTDGGHTATCVVTVNAPIIEVTGIIGVPTEFPIAEGATLTLTPAVQPANATDKALIYESSNTNIATVSAEGVVTGVSSGTATITVTAMSNNTSVTCEVTVEAVVTDTPVSNITLSVDSKTLAIGDDFILTATTNADATNQTLTATIKDSKTEASISSNGTNSWAITGVSKGKVTVDITADNGLVETCEITIEQLMDIAGTYNVTSVTIRTASEEKIFDSSNTNKLEGEVSINTDSSLFLTSTGRFQFIPKSPMADYAYNDYRYYFLPENRLVLTDKFGLTQAALKTAKYNIKSATTLEYTYVNTDGSVEVTVALTKIGGYTAPIADKTIFVTPLNIFEDPKSAEGHYVSTFFYTSGISATAKTYGAITSDCSNKPTSNKYGSYDDCKGGNGPADGAVGNVKGEMGFVLQDGKLKAVSKMQMDGHKAFDASADDKFQYMVYTAIPVLLNANNDNLSSSDSVKGVSGQNNSSSTTNPKSEYTYRYERGTNIIESELMLVDKVVKIFITLKVTVITTSRAEKINDRYTEIPTDKYADWSAVAIEGPTKLLKDDANVTLPAVTDIY